MSIDEKQGAREEGKPANGCHQAAPRSEQTGLPASSLPDPWPERNIEIARARKNAENRLADLEAQYPGKRWESFRNGNEQKILADIDEEIGLIMDKHLKIKMRNMREKLKSQSEPEPIAAETMIGNETAEDILRRTQQPPLDKRERQLESERRRKMKNDTLRQLSEELQAEGGDR